MDGDAGIFHNLTKGGNGPFGCRVGQPGGVAGRVGG